MQDIMIRIQAGDFGAWKEQRYLHAASRARYGITGGPAYRDLAGPGAALFHISAADMDTAMGWFRGDTFREATRPAKVTGRGQVAAELAGDQGGRPLQLLPGSELVIGQRRHGITLLRASGDICG